MVREGCEESCEEAEEDGAAGRAGESCHHPELQHQVCHHPQVQLAAGVAQVQLGPSPLGRRSISCLCEVRVTAGEEWLWLLPLSAVPGPGQVCAVPFLVTGPASAPPSAGGNKVVSVDPGPGPGDNCSKMV